MLSQEQYVYLTLTSLFLRDAGGQEFLAQTVN